MFPEHLLSEITSPFSISCNAFNAAPITPGSRIRDTDIAKQLGVSRLRSGRS